MDAWMTINDKKSWNENHQQAWKDARMATEKTCGGNRQQALEDEQMTMDMDVTMDDAETQSNTTNLVLYQLL